jgi:cation-transporting P-type ATPase 13A2
VNLDGKKGDDYNFAVTGQSFAVLRKHFPQIFERILVNGTIYARMSPDQKAQLVEHLISIGYCVSMCGDGANDCGALKAGKIRRISFTFFIIS